MTLREVLSTLLWLGALIAAAWILGVLAGVVALGFRSVIPA